MTKTSSQNARIKREYMAHLRGPGQCSQSTIEKRAASLTFFERANGYKDFKKHSLSWPEKVQEALNDARTPSGGPLSASTKSAYLRDIRGFVSWLSCQPGYKSKINYHDADYYQLSKREERIAKADRDPVYPLMKQTLKAFDAMPCATEIEHRDKAVFALLVMTGARVTALTTFRLKHVDTERKTLQQDAREVETKFGKTIFTSFYIPDQAVWACLEAWTKYLYDKLNFGPNDPLFPKSNRALNEVGEFITDGVTRAHWSQTGSIRKIVKDSFERVHMHAYGPHSFRHMLTHVGMDLCTTPHDLKAWSQNFGHSDVMTTLSNYGKLTNREQSDVMRKLSSDE